MNWQGLELSILGPACLAGFLVLSTHVPLGQQVLARGIIFIDLAIAQVAALGEIARSISAWTRPATASR
jgi:zinc/manganese transport system permease protein